MGRKRKAQKRSEQLEVSAAMQEKRKVVNTEHGLTPYAKINRAKKGVPGIPLPMARTRFFMELEKRPEDLEIYRRFVEHYNEQSDENYTMEEIMDRAAMRMVLDKFLAFSLQCENPDDASRMREIHSMVKGMYTLLMKQSKQAGEREAVDDRRAHQDLAARYKPITDADYEVLDDESKEEDGNGKAEGDEEGSEQESEDG